MTPLRLILSAGVCSIALNGCIPVAASLALQAASLVTGGGKEGKGFRNPMDKQTSERQVREALSRLNDRVDPACQAQLDAMEKKTDKPDATAAGTAPAKDAGAPVTSAKPQEAVPVNLLAKVGPEQGQADAARTADTAPGAASDRAAAEAAPAQPAAAEAAKGDDETKPVKVALAPSGTAAPGQCEHRLVCLPGTPKPTLMLMCPGKSDPKAGGKTVAAGDAPADAQASNAPATDAPVVDAKAADAKAVDAQTPAVIPAVAKATPSEPVPVVTPAAAVSITPTAAGVVRPPSTEDRRATTRAPSVPVVVPPPVANAAPAAATPVATPATTTPAKETAGAVPKLTIPAIAAPTVVSTPSAIPPAPGAAGGEPQLAAPVVTPTPPGAPTIPAVAGAAPTIATPDIMPTIGQPLVPPPALDASTASADRSPAPAAAGGPKAVPTAVPTPAPKASVPSGPGRSIESGGVADWNWSYDPAKQL